MLLVVARMYHHHCRGDGRLCPIDVFVFGISNVGGSDFRESILHLSVWPPVLAQIRVLLRLRN